MNLQQNKKTDYLIISLIYFTVFCIYTFPLITNITSSFIGAGDVHIYVFNIFNFKSRILNLESPFYTDLMFYPKGGSTLMHAGTWTMSIFASFFPNIILGMNIYLILTYVTAGVGAYIFAYKYLQNKYYAFLSGFIYAFSNYMTSRLLGHYNLVLTAAIPFLLYYFLLVFDNFKGFRHLWEYQKKSTLILLSLFVFSVFSDYVVTIGFIYFTFFYWLFYIIDFLYCKYKPKTWKIWVGGFIILLVFDQLIQLLRKIGIDDKGGIWHSGDLVSYFIPYHIRFFDFETLLTFHQNVIGKSYGIETVLFLGYTMIALAIYALFLKKSTHFPKPIQAISFCVLMLFFITMPAFEIAGKRLFFLPTALQHFLPFTNNMRVPTRVIYLLVYLLSLIVFYTILNSKKGSFFKNPTIVFFLFTLFFFEYYPSKFPFQNNSKVPEVYRRLGLKKENVALIYPYGVLDGFKKVGKFDCKELSLLRIHHKKIYGGHLSRLSDKQFEIPLQSPFLRNLIEIEEGRKPGFEIDDLKQDVLNFDVDYILIPTKYISSNGHDFIKRSFGDRVKNKENFQGGIIYEIENL